MSATEIGQHPKTVLFWCCRPLGLRTLEHLLTSPTHGKRYQVAAVVTSERDWCRDAIAARARRSGVPVYGEEDDVGAEYDLGYCTGFSYRIGGDILRRCRQGAFNLHFAPLPAYRGSGTLTHAIINQETEFGVTLHLMDATLDTGPVVAMRTWPLSQDRTAAQLTVELEALGFRLFVDTFDDLLDGSFELTDQQEIADRSGILPRFYTRDSVQALYRLELGWDFERLERYLRALTLPQSSRRPYVEKFGRRIYLSLTDGPDVGPIGQPRQQVAVGALILRQDGQVLLVRRSPEDDFLPGVWEVPGGGCEYGETPKDALEREVLEECGLAVTVHVPLAVDHYTMSGTQRVMILFLCTVANPEFVVVLSREHDAAVWVAVDALGDHDIDEFSRGLLATATADLERLAPRLLPRAPGQSGTSTPSPTSPSTPHE